MAKPEAASAIPSATRPGTVTPISIPRPPPGPRTKPGGPQSALSRQRLSPPATNRTHGPFATALVPGPRLC